MGSLSIILGCMFSGKSTEIIQRYRKYKSQRKNVFLINHISDIRYGHNVVITHNKDSVPCLSCNTLTDLLTSNKFKKADIIMIEEAQFFKDLFTFVTISVDKYNKIIVVAGLDGDYKRQAFGDVLKLIPYADEVIKLTTKCKHCNNKAIFTQRIVGNEQQCLVGGKEYYIPVCRKHFLLI